MTEEIKDILESLQYNDHIGTNDKRKLRDYITNLQQELEEYKDIETYSKRFLYKANKDRLNANLELVKELEDYKSRCGKAIEYVEQHKFNKFGDIDCGEAEAIIDILKGKGSDE